MIIDYSFNQRSIPHSPGVYIMKDASANVIYVGKAKNLQKRIASYFKNDGEFKTNGILKALKHIDFVLAQNENEALVIEERLIKKYKPYFNVLLKDDKTYPYIKITKEDFPRLILTRSRKDRASAVFGPYPHVKHIKYLLKWMRKVFKWRYCNYDFSLKIPLSEKKIKTCFYFHSGLCPAPCTGKTDKASYNKSINAIKLFLKGNHSKLIAIWKKDMKAASQNMQFEAAGEIRDRINALDVSSKKVSVRELKQEDIDFSLDVSNALEDLKNLLEMKKWPVAIEGFDISNLSGTNSVGSMVRFFNGKEDKNGYRKFKIRSITGQNDPGMIYEVVKRRYSRLKEEKSRLPDLIMVDGGKTQLNAALNALNELNLKITLVSLAKREEEIYLPGKEHPLKLLKTSKALQLLQKVRDEAHRFAVSFQRNRRKKDLLK